MKNILSDNTKVASYLLWEYTGHNNALDLWYCAENIAFYFENINITNMVALNDVLKKSKYDFEYITFVRHISYCVFISANNKNSKENWYCAENLLENIEWCKAMVTMAYAFRMMREGNAEKTVRSDWIRKNLENNKIIKRRSI